MSHSSDTRLIPPSRQANNEVSAGTQSHGIRQLPSRIPVPSWRQEIRACHQPYVADGKQKSNKPLTLRREVRRLGDHVTASHGHERKPVDRICKRNAAVGGSGAAKHSHNVSDSTSLSTAVGSHTSQTISTPEQTASPTYPHYQPKTFTQTATSHIPERDCQTREQTQPNIPYSRMLNHWQADTVVGGRTAMNTTPHPRHRSRTQPQTSTSRSLRRKPIYHKQLRSLPYPQPHPDILVPGRSAPSSMTRRQPATKRLSSNLSEIARTGARAAVNSELFLYPRYVVPTPVVNAYAPRRGRRRPSHESKHVDSYETVWRRTTRVVRRTFSVRYWNGMIGEDVGK